MSVREKHSPDKTSTKIFIINNKKKIDFKSFSNFHSQSRKKIADSICRLPVEIYECKLYHCSFSLGDGGGGRFYMEQTGMLIGNFEFSP